MSEKRSRFDALVEEMFGPVDCVDEKPKKSPWIKVKFNEPKQTQIDPTEPYCSVGGRAYQIVDLDVSVRIDSFDRNLISDVMPRSTARVSFKVATILRREELEYDCFVVLPQGPAEPIYIRLQVVSTRWVQTATSMHTEIEGVEIGRNSRL